VEEHGVFTPRRIALAAFLGGPVTAGLMIARNYRIFGRRGPAVHATFAGIISGIVILWSFIWYIPPAFRKTPLIVFASFFSFFTYYLAEKLQGKAVRKYLRSGGKHATSAYIFFFLMIGIFFSVATLFIIVPPARKDPNTETIKNEEVAIVFSDTSDHSLRDSLTGYFRQTHILSYFYGENFKLSDEGSFYLFSLITGDTIPLYDGLLAEDLYTLQQVLNARFHFEKPLFTGITDTSEGYILLVREPLHPLLYAKKKSDSFHLYIIRNDQLIRYTEDVPQEDVEILAEVIRKLKYYFPPSQDLEIIFTKWGETNEIRFLSRPGPFGEDLFIERLRNTGQYIQYAGLSGPIYLYLTNMDAHRETILLILSEDTLLNYASQ